MMNEKLELLKEVLEMEEDELTEDMNLDELENWDSMAKLSLIVMVNDEFDKKLSGDQVKAFKTVKDILDVMV